MRKAAVYLRGEYAGELTEISRKKCLFRYDMNTLLTKTSHLSAEDAKLFLKKPLKKSLKDSVLPMKRLKH